MMESAYDYVGGGTSAPYGLYRNMEAEDEKYAQLAREMEEERKEVALQLGKVRIRNFLFL